MDARTAWVFVQRLGKTTVANLLDRHALDFAGSIAYRVLFSLFPLAILLVGIFAVVERTTGVEADVVTEIVEYVPLTGEGRDELERLLLAATDDLSALGLLGIVGLIWAASGMMTATRKAVNMAWDTEQPRSFVRGKLLDIGLVFAASVVILLSLALSIAFRAAEDATTAALDWFGLAATIATWGLGVAVPALLAFVVIIFAYRILPATRPPLLQLLPGAIFATVAFAILQQGFVVYVRHFATYDVVYGSLGTIIAFLLFVYLAAAVFLAGIHVARRWPEALAEAHARTA
jgi:membrane protein